MALNDSLLTIIEPIITSTQSLVGFLKIVFGGIFGLYIVLVILRWHEIRMLRMITTEIKKEVGSIKASVKEIQEFEQNKMNNNKKNSSKLKSKK
jgi:hypothetical protein